MPTINDRLRDESIAHSLWVSRYSTGVASRMVKTLNQSDADLTARLLVAIDDLPADSFTVKRLESLLSGVRDINKQAIDAMYGNLADELLSLAEHESGYQYSLFDSLLPKVVKNHFPLHSITTDMLYAATMSQPFQGRLLRDWADNLADDRLRRIVNTVRQGYLLGDTTESIARKVRGTANKGYQDGILQISRANAASITKTAVNHLAATARNSFAKANADIIKSKQWLSTLDNKTSPPCIIRDRLMYTLEGKPLGHKIPYLQGPGRIHFCCRSTEVLVTKSWREMGINADDMGEGTRASMDGQVPADTNFSTWLESQSQARQEQVLGIKRAKLLREGNLKVSDFFSDKGEMLTLDELREYDRQAFIDAGIS